jgi:voltage-gated potassium channel
VIAAEFQPQESIDFTGLKAELLYIVRGDYTKVALLRRTNLCSASMVVILADQVVFRSDQDLDARTVLAALTIEKLAPGVFTCVELLNSDNESHLKMAGVEEVIIHDVFRADVLAVACLNRGLGHVIHDLLSRGDGTGFFTADVPASWIGLELDLVFLPLKRSADAVVVGLIGSGGVVANPPLSTRFSAGDRLVLVAARAPDLATVPVPPQPPAGLIRGGP